MKFYCDQCNAQYMIADSKVGERGVKVRCKRCENVIVIRPPAPAGSDEETVFPPPPGNEERTRYPEEDGAAAAKDEDLALPPLDGGADAGDEDEPPDDTAIAGSPYGDNAAGALADDEDDDLPTTAGPSSAPEPAAVALAAEGDLLDSELSGAFDNVFGENGDPFAARMTGESPDQSRRETRFYSNNELAQVAEERAAAEQAAPLMHDEISLPAAPRSEKPAGGNGAGRSLFAGLAAPEPEAAPPARAGFDTTRQWYVAIDDDQVGPVSVEDLASYWDQRRVDADSLVWQSGLPDWMPVRDVLDLRDLVQAKTTARPPRTEVEKPRALAAGLDIPGGELPDEASGASPFDVPDDPFAVAAAEAALPSDLAGSGTWRPHGMTEIYQAASLAESSAMQPIPDEEPAAEEEEEVNWQPGAASALAALVEHEIESIKHAPIPHEGLPIAEDSDVSGRPLPPLDDLLSTRPINLPDAEQPGREDPFSQHVSVSSTDDINIEQIAGQSSMVLKRPTFAAPKKPGRQVNWPLILGAGGGGLALIGLFIVVLVLLLRQPPAPVVVQAPVVPPVTPAVAGAQPATPTPAPPTTPPTTPDPGTTTASEPQPGKAPAADDRDDGARKTGSGGSKVTRRPDPKDDTRTSVRPEPRPEPKPDPKPTPPPVKKGNCDPILYPDGNCPTGNAAMPEATSSKKTTLSKTDILMTVKKNLGDVKKCAAEQAKRNPRLATGTLKMQWYIRADGHTKNVSVLDAKYKGTYIGGCVQDAIGKWKFSTFDGDDVGPIKFPFPLD